MKYLEGLSEEELNVDGAVLIQKHLSRKERKMTVELSTKRNLDDSDVPSDYEVKKELVARTKSYQLPVLEELNYCKEVLSEEESVAHYDDLLSVIQEINQISFDLMDDYYELDLEDKALEMEHLRAEYSKLARDTKDKRNLYLVHLEDEKKRNKESRIQSGVDAIHTKVFEDSSYKDREYVDIIASLTEEVNKWSKEKDIHVMNISFETTKIYTDRITLGESYGRYQSIHLKEHIDGVYCTVVYKEIIM